MSISCYFCKKNFIFILLFLLLFVLFSNAEEFFVEDFGYYLDIPEGWEIIDDSNIAKLAFADPTLSVVFQVYVYKGRSFNDSEDIFTSVRDQLSAKGEGAKFSYNGKDSFFADLNFNTGKYDVKGYFVFINEKKYDYAFFCFTTINNYGKYHEYLLSAIDSFSLSKEGKLKPGPVSQFYFPFPANHKEPIQLTLYGKNINTSVNKEEIEATQLVVEREARILSKYTEDQLKAWHRSYRLIYRDNYERILGFTEMLKKELNLNSLKDPQKVKTLLTWIQNFEFYRTGTLADMTSPLASAFTFAGDCDSRGLLFLIILHQLGIDARLLVSTRFNHSAIAINVKGDGARFDFDDKSYLYTELTEKIDIGMIPSKMADPSGWISMQFGNY